MNRILYLLLLFLGAVLSLPFSISPDQNISALDRMGALFLSLAFVLAIESWGAFLLKRMQISDENLGVRLSVGSAFFALLAGLIGFSGFLGGVPGGVSLGVLLLYPVLNPPLKGIFLVEKPDRFQKGILFLIAFSFLTYALVSSLPFPHGDPLSYQILSAREWAQEGRISFYLERPLHFQGGAWEYLFFWLQKLVLFFEPVGRSSIGLVEAHLFSQWIHLFVGGLGSVLMGYELLKKECGALFNRDRDLARWLILGAFSILFIAGSRGYVVLAKNDWGVSLWALCGAYFLFFFSSATSSASSPLSPNREGLKIFLGSFLLGLAMGSKYTVLFFALPVVIRSLVLILRSSPLSLRSHQLKWSAALFSGFSLGALVILGRNAFYTGNPFFPVLSNLFPSPVVTKTLMDLYEGVQGSASFLHPKSWVPSLKALSLESPIIFGIFLLPLNKEIWKATKVFVLVLLFAVFLFSGKGVTEPRYALPILIPLCVLGSLGGYALATRFNSLKKAFLPLVLVVVLLHSGLPIFLFKRLAFGKFGDPATILLKHHTGGAMKRWMREHQEKLIAGTILSDDNEFYYLSMFNLTSYVTNPLIEKQVRNAKTPDELVHYLISQNIRYVLETAPSYGKDSEVFPKFKEWMKKHPKSVLLTEGEGFLIALEE